MVGDLALEVKEYLGLPCVVILEMFQWMTWGMLSCMSVAFLR